MFKTIILGGLNGIYHYSLNFLNYLSQNDGNAFCRHLVEYVTYKMRFNQSFLHSNSKSFLKIYFKFTSVQFDLFPE